MDNLYYVERVVWYSDGSEEAPDGPWREPFMAFKSLDDAYTFIDGLKDLKNANDAVHALDELRDVVGVEYSKDSKGTMKYHWVSLYLDDNYLKGDYYHLASCIDFQIRCMPLAPHPGEEIKED